MASVVLTFFALRLEVSPKVVSETKRFLDDLNYRDLIYVINPLVDLFLGSAIVAPIVFNILARLYTVASPLLYAGEFMAIHAQSHRLLGEG